MDLSHSNLGDNPVLEQLLSSTTSLKTLKLSESNITDMGLRYLVKGLEQNQLLENLDLSENKFRYDTVNLLAEVLKKNTTLQSLHLEIPYRTLVLLVDALKNNQTLQKLYLLVYEDSSSSPNIVINDTLPKINDKKNTTLKELHLSGFRFVWHRQHIGYLPVVKKLLKDTSLEILDLSKNYFGDRVVIELLNELNLTTLQTLNLSENEITVDGANFLASKLENNQILKTHQTLFSTTESSVTEAFKISRTNFGFKL